MSATNLTTHYNLPSFLGSDKPAWLVDWNGAMTTIDSAIYEAKQAADNAGTAVSSVASDLATLSGTVSTQGSTISTLSDTLTTAVGNINTINGNITTINSLIGNGTPTTTDQTIIGAINEINADVTTLKSDVTWKLVGTATGRDTINIPASFKELHINVHNSNHDTFTFDLIPSDIPAAAGTDYNFSSGWATASGQAFCQIIVNSTTVKGFNLNILNTSYNDSMTVELYYR